MKTFTYAVPVTLKSYDITTAATGLVEVNFKIFNYVAVNIPPHDQAVAMDHFTREVAKENLKHFSDEDGLKVRLLAADMMDKMIDATRKGNSAKRKGANL